MMDDLERALLEAQKVEPDVDMRARVLGATAPLVRPDRSALDRIWFSPRWRVAAVLAALVIAVLNIVPAGGVSSAIAPQDLRPDHNTEAVAKAAREAGFTPDDTAALCAQAIAAARAAMMRTAGAGV